MRAATAVLASTLLAALVMQSPARGANAAEPAQLAFDEGRRLEDAGDFAGAAARFEESERLAPAIGTILNLANCYEKNGRLARAWRAFRRGAEEAGASGEAKRARRASDRADALRERLSTLVVRAVGDAAPGEEIRLDGAVLDRAQLGIPLPVDGGKHVLLARAPGRLEASVEVTVADERGNATVDVPELAPVRVAEPPPPPQEPIARPDVFPPPAPLEAPAAPASSPWTPLRIGAIVSSGVGLVAVGLGVGYGLQASERWSDRQANCVHNYCNDAGYALTGQARDSATRSTVAFSIGGLGLAAGAALWFLSPRGRKSGMTVTGGVLAGGAAVRWEGVF